MMEIGKIQKLKVIKEKDFGIYLSDGGCPGRPSPEEAGTGGNEDRG